MTAIKTAPLMPGLNGKPMPEPPAESQSKAGGWETTRPPFKIPR